MRRFRMVSSGYRAQKLGEFFQRGVEDFDAVLYIVTHVSDGSIRMDEVNCTGGVISMQTVCYEHAVTKDDNGPSRGPSVLTEAWCRHNTALS